MKLFIVIGLLALGSGLGCSNGKGPVAPPPTSNPQGFAPYQGGYRLPVDGEWKVARTHYGAKNDQAYAVDLIVVADTPRDGTNADYPTYRQAIVADGPGVVATVVDGVAENEPGRVNPYEMHGNFVVLDHRNGEFSLFAHFIPGSIRVRVGEVVGMGQLLGLCGNSGHSTMAHLHWQVMNNFAAHRAAGLPIRLLPYLKRGTLTSERLEKGDHVAATK
ncbi:MAG: M23 family metallopeptidase [Myxococcales bacterium]|nr:M23 family metallopeptidase [Myxococcales bacterium]